VNAKGFGLPGNSQRPSPGSLLARWLERTASHPDSFVCGVRVVSGVVDGESRRWRYRRSAVDPLVVDGVTVLYHGDRALRLRSLRFDDRGVDGAAARPGFVVGSALEQSSGARVLVACAAGRVEALGG
jgi:hypothetical protein